MEKWYNCTTYKKMTQGIAGSSQNKCLLCRVLKLNSCYRQIKYKKLTKKQIKVKYTTLNKKLKDIEDQQSKAKYLEQSLFLSIEPTKGPPPPR